MATPFIQQIYWLLFAEGIAIIFLVLPFHVPYRRSAVDWLANAKGPILDRIRFVFGVTHFMIGLLWADNLRRLWTLDSEVDVMKQADAVVSRDALFTLYSRRGRAQRDNLIMLAELYSSFVIYLLHLMVLRTGRYRNERNVYREKYETLAKKHGVTIESAKTTAVETAAGSGAAVKRK